MILGSTGLVVSFETLIVKIIHYTYFIGNKDISEDKDHDIGSRIDKKTDTDGQESCKHLNAKPCKLSSAKPTNG